MWIDLDSKKIDTKIQFQLMMKGVLYRQLNSMMGLRIQISLIQEYIITIMKKLALKSLFSSLDTIDLKEIIKNTLQKVQKDKKLNISDLLSNIETKIRKELKKEPKPSEFAKIHRKIEIYEEELKGGNQLKQKEIKRELHNFIMKSGKEFWHFFGLDSEEDIRDIIESCFIEWIQKKKERADWLLQNISVRLLNRVPLLYSVIDQNFNMKEHLQNNKQETFDYFLGGQEKGFNNKRKQFDLWNPKQTKDYYRDIQKHYQIHDWLRLNFLMRQSFKQAVLDAISSFEDWLAFYLSSFAEVEPSRFLNTNGINPKLRGIMAKIIDAYNNQTKDRQEIIAKLMEQEKFNIGFSGAYLKKYLTEHVGLDFPDQDEMENLFTYYKELRNLRNDLIHPKSIEKSNIAVPKTVNEFEEIIKRLTLIGEYIIDNCGLIEIKL